MLPTLGRLTLLHAVSGSEKLQHCCAFAPTTKHWGSAGIRHDSNVAHLRVDVQLYTHIFILLLHWLPQARLVYMHNTGVYVYIYIYTHIYKYAGRTCAYTIVPICVGLPLRVFGYARTCVPIFINTSQELWISKTIE